MLYDGGAMMYTREQAEIMRTQQLLSKELFKRLADKSGKDIDTVASRVLATRTYSALMDPTSEFYAKSVEELIYLLQLESRRDIKTWERQAILKY